MARYYPESLSSEAIRLLDKRLSELGGCELACARSVFMHAATLGDFEALTGFLVEVLSQMEHVDEARVARGMCSHWLAAKSQFVDDSRRARLSTPNRCLLALDEVDLIMRTEEGRPLRVVGDYRDHKPSWAPAVKTIERWFGSWERALGAAGLLACGQPEMHLGRQRARRAQTGWPAPTSEQLVAALATAIEHNFGRRVSAEGYDDIREVLDGGLPSYNQLIGVHGKGKGKGSGHRKTLAEMDALAREHIVRHPDQFPVAADYITRTRDLRGNGGP